MRDRLTRSERQLVGDMLPLRVPTALGQLVGLDPVDLALICEEEQPVVSVGDEELRDLIIGAQRRATYALAPTLLGPVLVQSGPLREALTADGYDNILLGNQSLNGNLWPIGDNLGDSVITKLLINFGKFLADDLSLPRRTVEDSL